MSRFLPKTRTNPREHIERVWLPLYLVTFHVSSPKGPGFIRVFVEAYSGAFAIFQMNDAIVEGALAEEWFPPKMSEQEAVERGRAELLHTILRQRGAGGKPLIETCEAVEVLHYPFWVFYYERRPGLLDIKVLDAATGDKAGAKTKAAILEAFKLHAGGSLDK